MQSPLGYDSDARTVKWLSKSLYGLKQAGCKWYDTLEHTLSKLQFFKMHTDLGVFIAHIGKHILILVVHVNDCMFTGSSKQLIAAYKDKLNACYALTDLGPIQ